MDEMSTCIQVMFKVIDFLACSDMIATAITFEIPRLCQMYTSPPPPGGYPLIWAIRGCAAGQGMVSFSLSYSGYIISHESVLNRVYNFAQVCPKQCA